MKNLYKISAIICIVFVLAVGVTGCVTSNTSPTTAPTATPVPTATPTAPTATPTAPTAAPTAAPKATGNDYSKAIEQNWVSKGYTVATPFIKTTVDGREAYQGAVTDSNGTTAHVTLILTSTIADAQNYASTRLSGFESQGYTVVSNSNGEAVLTNSNGDVAGVAQYSVVYGTNSPGVGIIEA
jgi:hypothetical protein